MIVNQEKPVYFYMANLGSEIERIFVWREKGVRSEVVEACNRADMIIRKLRAKELTQSAELEISMLNKIVQDIKDEKVDIQNRRDLNNYFFPFAQRVVASLGV